MHVHQHRENVPRARVRYKAAVLLLAVGLVGLLCLVFSIMQEHGVAAKIASEVGSILIIGGFLGWANEQFIRKDLMEVVDQSFLQVLEKLELSGEINQLGMCTVLSDAKDYDYGEMIRHSKYLAVRLNDGRTWVSQHNEALEERLKDSTKTTTFYLIHPRSPMIEVLARMEGKGGDDIRYKIRDTIRELQKYTTTNDNIKVYGHYLFNAFGGFMTEDVAIITLYFASRGKKKVPLFAFDRGAADAFYHRMQVDLRELAVDSEDMTSAVVTDKAWLGVDADRRQ